MHHKSLNLDTDYRILITVGLGFIASSLFEILLENGNHLTCLDSFANGKRDNIKELPNKRNFELIQGDIRNLEVCKRTCANIDYVLHQAALGSVPRSIKASITSSAANISGFLNMPFARDTEIRRFAYTASFSTHRGSNSMPKLEEVIGKPLFPSAITKYANELYAEVFAKTYHIGTIGLCYFNVFGRKQDPNGTYEMVIPKFHNIIDKI
ncbi:NAD-dependent epimerase/dehydratase family protein [Ulvibacterium sp.]|uniref:NAD-dependent epimerase/dehydratase family protein n=1 Tax=Ulvibacterium sp. TaxID=2665914 RepID=UPI003BAD3010